MRSLTIALCLLVAPLRRGFLLPPHASTFPPCPSRPCPAPPLTECASKTADTLLLAAACAAQVLVLRFQRLFPTVNLFDDGAGGCRPDKGLGVGVVVFEIIVDRSLEVWSCYAKVESTYCNRRCSMGRGIRFTTEFKREAVRLVLSSGRPRAEIAEDLGVGLSSLTRWIGQYRDEEMPPEIKDDLQAELKRLRKENAVLRQERDILKKAAAFFAKEGSR